MGVCHPEITYRAICLDGAPNFFICVEHLRICSSDFRCELQAVRFSSTFGLSFVLGMISDWLRVLTAPVPLLFDFFSAVYRTQVCEKIMVSIEMSIEMLSSYETEKVGLLSSLWKLFRGKKWNVLR
jgi:hypothetical protein